MEEEDGHWGAGNRSDWLMAQTNQIIHKVWGEVEGGETEKSGCNKIAKGLAVLSDQ